MANTNEDNIRIAAYYIWEQAGRPEGAEKECWIKACEQLFSPKKATKKAAAKPAAKKVEPKKAAAKPAAPKVAPKPAAKKPAPSATPFYGIKKK
ncbi:MAG: DUF2934 domain-containing protein [Lactobacillales bacterium]|jgi:hypothetical protein|nr:DUF2934 domain-containing protein [Lactobacillales bacterium]